MHGACQGPAHTSWSHSSQRCPKPTQPSHLLITLQDLLLHTLFLLFLHLFCTLSRLQGLPQALFPLPGQCGQEGPSALPAPKVLIPRGNTRQVCADQGKRRGKGAQLTASFLPDAVSSPPPLSSSSVPQPPASSGGSPVSASPSPEGRRAQTVPGAGGCVSPQAAWYTQALLEVFTSTPGWGDNTYLATGIIQCKQRERRKNLTPSAAEIFGKEQHTPAVGDHLPQEPGKWWRGSTVQPGSEARSPQLSPVPAENTCTEILSPHHWCGQRAAGHWREGRVWSACQPHG